jgi:hypothetical protein
MKLGVQLRILLIALTMTSLPAIAATQLKIVTNNGAVSFVVDDNWPVIKSQTRLPVAAIVFQLPNLADEQTSHSSNLVLKLYDTNVAVGQQSYATAMDKRYDAIAPKVERWNGWMISRQQSQQHGVPYTILDAKRPDVADVSVSVRLAWPHLAANVRSYDQDMERRFREFLQSVQGQSGKYTPEKGEVIRRPSK